MTDDNRTHEHPDLDGADGLAAARRGDAPRSGPADSDTVRPALAKPARARRMPRPGGSPSVGDDAVAAADNAPPADGARARVQAGDARDALAVREPGAPVGVRYPPIRSKLGGRKGQYGDAGLCTQLRTWRERRTMSQCALALSIGVSSPNISHYERGSRAPSKEVCKRLRVVLSLTDAEYIQLLETS